VVSRIAGHKTSISTNARPGASSPKKITLQKSFSASWTENSAITIFVPENPARGYTNQAEAAIERYRTVHTGPNTESGGVKNGLSRYRTNHHSWSGGS
jgi:hypothetical protein